MDSQIDKMHERTNTMQKKSDGYTELTVSGLHKDHPDKTMNRQCIYKT